MSVLTICEFDKIVEAKAGFTGPAVPKRVFDWLDMLAVRNADGATNWLRPSQVGGRRAVQVTSHVGVIRAPCGFQIEVLPKISRTTSPERARAILIKMLKCLTGFRHIRTANADLVTERMPLLEVFIQEFLVAVHSLVKRGLRSDYVVRQDNLFTPRGRLLMARQVTQNLLRPDRFFTEHDEFSQDRAENRLIKTALLRVIELCRTQESQRFARELEFVFADVPRCADVAQDTRLIRLDRGMDHYEAALDWAKLILKGLSPLPGLGTQHAPSLLFPMEMVFEAYVERHLARQLQTSFALKAQSSSQHLVEHLGNRWFRLKPDLLVTNRQTTRLVLDTKWKLLDAHKRTGSDKYQLSQADFYQVYAYGHHYLNGTGDVALIYPATDTFSTPLDVFSFPQAPGLQLWVLPFCLETDLLRLPASAPALASVFARRVAH